MSRNIIEAGVESSLSSQHRREQRAAKSQVRIEVWSDYVCPFCYLEKPLLDRLAADFSDQVILQWRAFELRPEPVPLLDPDGEYIHAIWNRAVYPMAHLRGMKLRLPPLQPRSRLAFEAAEFARSQGRFNEMHEAIFRAFFQEARNVSSLSVLLQIGAEAGLDVEQLNQALESGAYIPRVREDERLAHELGITGVPTVLMSRTDAKIENLLSGAQSYELLRTTVERLLEF
jgi:predicted DsbA family dithiol-disulfide isomerase